MRFEGRRARGLLLKPQTSNLKPGCRRAQGIGFCAYWPNSSMAFLRIEFSVLFFFCLLPHPDSPHWRPSCSTVASLRQTVFIWQPPFHILSFLLASETYKFQTKKNAVEQRITRVQYFFSHKAEMKFKTGVYKQ